MGSYGETLDITSPFFKRLTNDQAILGQAVLMRLSTKRGTFWSDPEYGLCVSDYLNSELTQDQLVRIPFEVQAQLQLDERITSVSVDARTANNGVGGVRIILSMIVTANTGNVFPLTVAISALTVELLTQGTV